MTLHVKKLSLTVDNSSNCGGPGADGYFVAQVKMPDFCWKYEILVKVVGSVETMNAGYDEVALNGIMLFGSEERGIECGMKSASGSAIITVEGEDTVTLSYTTNDGLHHVGAYARVTDAKIVGRSYCQSGGNVSPGNGGINDDGSYDGAFRLDYPYDQAGYKLGFLLFASNISCIALKRSLCLVFAGKPNSIYNKSSCV